MYSTFHAKKANSIHFTFQKSQIYSHQKLFNCFQFKRKCGPHFGSPMICAQSKAIEGCTDYRKQYIVKFLTI